MNFGKPNLFILLGGSELLAKLALLLEKKKHKIFVVTSKRQIVENVGHETFEAFLENNRMDYVVSDDIATDARVLKKITDKTVGISLGGAWIFKADFINRFKGRLLNSHGSRLPADRGGGDFSWRIMNGERLGYCVMHQVDEGIDTGRIVKHSEFFFPSSCRIPTEYREFSIKQYMAFFEEFIDEIAEGKEFNLESQQEYFSTYFPRLSTSHHGYIDWRWGLNEIERFICAFDDPYDGASTFIGDKKILLKKCLRVINDGRFHPFQHGLVYRKTKDALFVACGEGSLVVKSVFDDRGNIFFDKVKVGDRFHTPEKFLEEAKQFRAIYTPGGLKV